MSGGDGNGWGTTQLPDGRNIHHYDPDKFGSHHDSNSDNNSYTHELRVFVHNN